MCASQSKSWQDLIRPSADESHPAYSCAICGKGFARSDVVKRHEALHESGSLSHDGSQVRAGSNKRQRNGDAVSTPASSSVSGTTPGSIQYAAPTPETTSNGSQPILGITTRQDTTRHDTTRRDTTRHDTTRHDTTRHDTLAVAAFPEPMPSSAQNRSLHDLWTNMNFDDLDIEGLTDEWLSHDFMSLPHDSDSLWNDFSVLPTYETNHVIHREPMSPLRTSHALSTSHHQGEQGPSLHSDCDVGPVSQDASDTRIRMVSPLNDVSNVDHIPYAWDPSSAVSAHEPFVEVHDDDALFNSHVPSHDISQSTYDRICRNYQVRTHGNQQHRSRDLPALGVFNLFLGLFFTRFHPQAPYLHLGTLDTNRDLRSHTLSIMAAIGAVYSGKKGSRRFAVHMFEESRRQFQTTIEVDNTLMRDPMTIYSGFLICFTGIWCGNKRAFELAEALRGQIVTYIRKLGAPSSRSDTTAGGALNDQWRQWIHDESLKRLQWLIYQLDAQFPTLLHISPMMSLTEILDWSCPCDDEFWSASSARHWKSLLGPASIPPSKSFSGAIAAFMYPGLGGLPVLRLNCWSAYLLITAIHVQIFAYSEVRQARNMYSEEYDLELPADTEWRRKLSGKHSCRIVHLF